MIITDNNVLFPEFIKCKNAKYFSDTKFGLQM